jgi:hypothetical protein
MIKSHFSITIPSEGIRGTTPIMDENDSNRNLITNGNTDCTMKQQLNALLQLLRPQLVTVYEYWGEIQVRSNVIVQFLRRQLCCLQQRHYQIQQQNYKSVQQSDPSDEESGTPVEIVSVQAEESLLIIEWSFNQLRSRVVLLVNSLVDEQRNWIQMWYLQEKHSCEFGLLVDLVVKNDKNDGSTQSIDRLTTTTSSPHYSIAVTQFRHLPDSPVTEYLPLTSLHCRYEKPLVSYSDFVSKRSSTVCKSPSTDKDFKLFSGIANSCHQHSTTSLVHNLPDETDSLLDTFVFMAQRVYSQFGWSLKESQYQERLLYELRSSLSPSALRVPKEVHWETNYPPPALILENYKELSLFRSDLVLQPSASAHQVPSSETCNSSVIVELKANQHHLERVVHQIAQYLYQSGIQYGLICGFPNKPVDQLLFILVQMTNGSSNDHVSDLTDKVFRYEWFSVPSAPNPLLKQAMQSNNETVVPYMPPPPTDSIPFDDAIMDKVAVVVKKQRQKRKPITEPAIAVAVPPKRRYTRKPRPTSSVDEQN